MVNLVLLDRFETTMLASIPVRASLRSSDPSQAMEYPAVSDNLIKGKAQTVLGLVDPQSLGPTMTHEHLLIDFRVMFNPPADASVQHRSMEPITLENVGWVRYNHYSSLDNVMLMDEDVKQKMCIFMIAKKNVYRI